MLTTQRNPKTTQATDLPRFDQTLPLAAARRHGAYRVCRRCVMDTTDPQIEFDAEGTCNHCKGALHRIQRELPPPHERQARLQQMAQTIKREGEGKEYDCIIGVSGGIDSTFTAWYVKRLGLRPLAVHFDNGWNSELAVDNVKIILDRLGIDLYTHVVDWEEFRDLQLCYLKASVPNCEAPTDHGITALLLHTAVRFNTRFVLIGGNLATESILPIAWAWHSHDLRLLRALHRRFGSVPLRSMPRINLRQYVYYVFVRGMRQIPFLNYVDYRKAEAKEMMEEEFGWRDYGGKHYESVYTRFFQGYYLPTKFGFDKRRAHLSSLIVSGQMSRDEALSELRRPAYDPELLRQDMQFVLKKFGMSSDQFDAILRAPPKMEWDYPSHHFLFERMRRYKDIFRRFATNL